MIIGNLSGGLGNQMFQFACARAVSQDLQLPLKFRTDFLNFYNAHNGFELERVFGLNLEIATDQELQELIGRVRSSVSLRRVFCRYPFNKIAGKNFIDESALNTLPRGSVSLGRGAYLHGYWQSEDYFSSHSLLVVSDFTFRDSLCGQNIELAAAIDRGVSISVHIRRGDYLTSPKALAVHGVCSSEYYFSAIDTLLGRCPGARLFAFSDDPQWVSEVLHPRYPDLVLVTNNKGTDSYIDMRLMSMCDHHVIANSSFSWWGAWLNRKKQKMVIAPAQWFADGRSAQRVLPRGWEAM